MDENVYAVLHFFWVCAHDSSKTSICYQKYIVITVKSDNKKPTYKEPPVIRNWFAFPNPYASLLYVKHMD